MGLIGQTVVTDPGEGRSSGYALVASSESVDPRDARHLTVAPQITDFLHIEDRPGPFFSFYPLPSGRWALTRRFVRGKRRGAFNRVVVHTLLLDRETLAELADEPWLLTRCRFRRTGDGPEHTPAELADLVAEPGVTTVWDLECRISDASRERDGHVARLKAFLIRRWGAEALAGRLGSMLAARAADRRLLLPQGVETEQLLALAWSVLPPADRLATAWTTHLAPASGSLFHMANAPEPQAARSDQDDPEAWVLPLQEAVDDPAGGSAALVRTVLAERPPEGLESSREHGLRLAGHSAQVRRWIVWLETGGAHALDGFEDEESCAAFFKGLKRTLGETGVDPWLDPSALLCGACHTVLRLHRRGRPADEALEVVDRVLLETRWRGKLLEAPSLAGLPRISLGPRALPVAVALAARRLPEMPAGQAVREELLERLLTMPPIEAPERHPFFVRVLADLTADLVGYESTLTDRALRGLTTLPGGLAAVLEWQEAREEDLPILLAVLRAAHRVDDVTIGTEVTVRFLFKVVEDTPALVMTLPEDDLRWAAEGLVRRPPEGDWAARTVRFVELLDRFPPATFLAWRETVARLAGGLDPTPEASALRAAWWQGLASCEWTEFPVEALDLLAGIVEPHRRAVAALWIPRIPHLDGRPGEGRLVSALGALLDRDNAEQVFEYNLGWLVFHRRHRELGLEEAVARAGRVARRGGSATFEPFLRRLLPRLLPREPLRRAGSVLGLLLSPRILPSVKRFLETEYRDASLQAAGTRLFGIVPGVASLARRGQLLLSLAARLGERWSAEPEGAEDFLRDAVRCRRFDVVAAFLGRSEGFLERTARDGDRRLVRTISDATASSSAHRPYLLPFVGELGRALKEVDRSR